MNHVCKGYCICGLWLDEILGFTKGAGLALVTEDKKKHQLLCQVMWAPFLQRTGTQPPASHGLWSIKLLTVLFKIRKQASYLNHVWCLGKGMLSSSILENAGPQRTTPLPAEWPSNPSPTALSRWNLWAPSMRHSPEPIFVKLKTLPLQSHAPNPRTLNRNWKVFLSATRCCVFYHVFKRQCHAAVKSHYIQFVCPFIKSFHVFWDWSYMNKTEKYGPIYYLPYF